MSLGSCSLDEYNPSAGSATITHYETWAGLQANCYSTLYHELYSKEDFLFVSECGTDLWLNPSGVAHSEQVFYYDGLGPARKEMNKTWQQSYSVIATCNSVINSAGDVTGGKAEDIAIRVAEAKVIRAFMHLTLTTYFGPIPLCKNVVGENNIAPHRDSMADIYSSITTDLMEAAQVLPEKQANYARVTKKTAYGLLARAYAQGAGEGLAGYWEKAKEIAEGMLGKNGKNPQDFGLTGNELYQDVADLWAEDNNRGSVNKEYLFVAAGLDANGPDAANAGTYFNATSYLYAHTRCNPNALNDIFNISTNMLLGTHNQGGTMAPTLHALEVYGDWDKRYENTFMTAFSPYTLEGAASDSYDKRTITITADMAKRYGMGESSEQVIHTETCTYDDEDDVEAKVEELQAQFPGATVDWENEGGPTTYKFTVTKLVTPAVVGKKIYPYAKLTQKTAGAGNQIIFDGAYAKGGKEANMDASVKNPFVFAMPLAEDEDRVSIYLCRENITPESRQNRVYACMPIKDLFGVGAEYPTDYRMDTYRFWEKGSLTQAQKLFPCLIKYNWVYDGVTRSAGYDFRNGDIAIMRMAEIYLIAAEANVALNNPGAAIPYIQALWDRAARPGHTAPQVQNVTEQDILDEYAREFAGEHMRWPVLKRHHALKSALEKYNKKAAASFNESIHYYRPIPQTFLDQISNAAEFGDNGYGYVGAKGF